MAERSGQLQSALVENVKLMLSQNNKCCSILAQAPEVPAASVRAVSSGGGLFGAFRRDKSQSEADIAGARTNSNTRNQNR